MLRVFERLAIFRRPEALTAVLVVLAFFAGSRESRYFLDVRYLLDASTLYVETGLLALGLTLVIVAGQIDLSVASMLALIAVCTARLMDAGWSAPLAGCAALLLGVGLGLVNGFFVAYAKMPSFMVTIATLAAYRGAAHAMLGSESVKVPTSFVGIDMRHVGSGPFPISLVILVVFAVAVGLVLHKTVLGRWIYSVGTNESASFYSGVPTAKVKLAVFALSGLLAAVAAMHMNSRLGVARFDDGEGLEVDVITAVVLGGASIFGGRGSVLGTVLALMLVALLKIGMGVANVTAEYQLAAVGSLLILAVLAANLQDRFWGSRGANLGNGQGAHPQNPRPSVESAR